VLQTGWPEASPGWSALTRLGELAAKEFSSVAISRMLRRRWPASNFHY